MAIRVEFREQADRDYVKEVNLAEHVQGLVEEVVERKPTEKEVVPTMAKILNTSATSGVQASKFISRIGNTPLVEVPSPNPEVKIYAKCEFMNPTGSIKDRIAEHILNTAESKGLLTRGSGQTVVAASSGNTGAAIAMACATRGYKCKIYTNTKCSTEKINAVKAYGGECIVGPSGKAADDPEHYQNLAIAEAATTGAYDVDQYDAPANPEAYYRSLGPEIWEQTRQTVTHFVAAGSTGGTISGVGRYLKEVSEGAVEVVLADPHGSCFSDYYLKGKHDGATSFLVEGVGKDSIPGAMDFGCVDWAIQISDAEAIRVCHELAQKEGMWVGSSAGLNVAAAQHMAAKMDKPGVIVTVLPDHGLKYLTKFYNFEWLEKQGVDLTPEGNEKCKRYKPVLFHGPETKCPDLPKTPVTPEA
eukprot:Hpha_TRINITY_DN15619_c4_g5::TRINITY_DN15619_c4_g5_i2::g.99392::m.99392/K01697/CBS; cystathionine beta-synthase